MAASQAPAVNLSVPERMDFPVEEEKILKYWEEIDAFQTSLKQSEGRPNYTFYDGPPFATGLPHYGHILAGTIKDVVTRYAHQTGHHVERRFGWDCHGLPIEFEIEKSLGIRTREEVLEYGIGNYNEQCRSIVMKFSSEWRTVVTRLGRWIDFDRDYKTMDKSFMESVWWVFAELFRKGLVYQGFKVMPFSTGCGTPLSNFEANMNYKDVSDPAIVVTFPLLDDPDTALVAWTTTPWTLPSNICLCVNPNFDYVKVKDKATEKQYILAECRLEQLYPKKKGKKPADFYEVLEKMKGSDLKGKQYKPLFTYFEHLRAESGAFQVLADAFVTSDAGTGIVHCAPGFGEDDYRVCLEAKVITARDVPCPVDHAGRYTEIVSDYHTKYVKDCDKEILQRLKSEGRVVQAGSIVHSYPFCWRSETPLLYRAVPSWFVAVEEIRDRLVHNNLEGTQWVPAFVKEKRFHNWLVQARDWAVSRDRFWGTPLPIWESPDGEERICIGSVAELEKLSGVKVNDLHRHHVDDIEIPSQRGPEFPPLKRIQAVFDCWFESGSMPYAERHYPFAFEGREQEFVEKHFPANFIAEGLDQTRGWFYTLLVLSTALFDKPAFNNVIVNGLVLASDGKKMSKRLKNYPDPMEVVHKYGADALRLYLINSPVVRAEPLRFKEEGVFEVVKTVFLPWVNAFRFMLQNVTRWQTENGKQFVPLSIRELADTNDNVMDRWIHAVTHSLIRFVREEMAAYRLYTVIPQLLSLIDLLTNWYVRMNRNRMKGDYGAHEAHQSLSQLFQVMLTLSMTMAPFTPYLTEYMYQRMRLLSPETLSDASVHFNFIPEYDEYALNPEVERRVSRMQQVINAGRLARERRQLGLKRPLKRAVVVHVDPQYREDVQSLSNYIKDELNVRDVEFEGNDLKYVNYSATLNFREVARRLGKDVKAVQNALKTMPANDVVQFTRDRTMDICGHKLTMDEDVTVVRSMAESDELKSGRLEAVLDGDVIVILDTEADDDLVFEGFAREMTNRIQKLRKSAGLVPEDRVDVYLQVLESKDDFMNTVFKNKQEYMESVVRGPVMMSTSCPSYAVRIGEHVDDVEGHKFRVTLTRKTVGFSKTFDCDFDLDPENEKHPGRFVNGLKTYFACKDQDVLCEEFENAENGQVVVTLDGIDVTVTWKKDVFPSVRDAL